MRRPTTNLRAVLEKVQKLNGATPTFKYDVPSADMAAPPQHSPDAMADMGTASASRTASVPEPSSDSDFIIPDDEPRSLDSKHPGMDHRDVQVLGTDPEPEVLGQIIDLSSSPHPVIELDSGVSGDERAPKNPQGPALSDSDDIFDWSSQPHPPQSAQQVVHNMEDSWDDDFDDVAAAPTGSLEEFTQVKGTAPILLDTTDDSDAYEILDQPSTNLGSTSSGQSHIITLLKEKIELYGQALQRNGIRVDSSVLDTKITAALAQLPAADYKDDSWLPSKPTHNPGASMPVPSSAPHQREVIPVEPSRSQAISPYFQFPGRSVVDHEVTSTASTMASSQAIDETVHEWSAAVQRVLKDKFGLSRFRPNQLHAINATLSGRDVIVLMPTGGGKSLCYQLPALITQGSTSGVTVVVSPLISLMRDQIYHLRQKNIPAAKISSHDTPAEKKEVFAALESSPPLLSLIYVSPEMLNASKAMQRALERLHDRNQLARLVIDEAHCVSSWGHDFRPDYQRLENLKTIYPGVPIMALTATANDRVLMDMAKCLRNDPVIIKASFNRPNLFYEVRFKSKDYSRQLTEICKDFSGQSGIVYCHSKAKCESVADKLQRQGIRAAFYHAGMDNVEREIVQENWQRGYIDVICATVAFGMGIDKPDVRYVIHDFLPRTIEGYYQETGRAGRDGKPSVCILFYNFGDTRSLQKMISEDGSLTMDNKEKHLTLLRKMSDYCANETECRRVQVLQYFQEKFEPVDCTGCNNCRDAVGRTRIKRDYTSESITILGLVRALQGASLTMSQCLELLRGARRKKFLDGGFDRAPGYGALRDRPSTEVQRLLDTLEAQGVLKDHPVRNRAGFAVKYLRVGSTASAVESGYTKVFMDVDTTAPQPNPPAKKRRGETPTRRAPPRHRPASAANGSARTAGTRRRAPARPSQMVRALT